MEAPTEIRTQVIGIRIRGDNHYTIGAAIRLCAINKYKDNFYLKVRKISQAPNNKNSIWNNPV